MAPPTEHAGPAADPPRLAALFLRGAAVWLGILALAIGNGAARELWLRPALGVPAAPLLSGAMLSAMILLAAWASAGWVAARSRTQLLALGAFWLGLTVAFEFTFGLLVQGRDLDAVLAPYAFKDGNIWPIVPMVTAASPWLAGRGRLRAGQPGPSARPRGGSRPAA